MLSLLHFLLILVFLHHNVISFKSVKIKNRLICFNSIKSIRSQFISQNIYKLHKSLQFILPLTILTGFTTYNVYAATEDEYISSLATMIEAKAIIQPTLDYVEFQSYDNARTNAQYILNQLQFQKNVKNLIQSSIDFCDDMDVIEEAQDAANRITNTLIQYDSSVYTCIFIPSDDGTVPPSAEKYRTEATNYYNSFKKDIDVLLRLANESQLKSAQAKAELLTADLPKFLFKKAVPKIIARDPKKG